METSSSPRCSKSQDVLPSGQRLSQSTVVSLGCLLFALGASFICELLLLLQPNKKTVLWHSGNVTDGQKSDALYVRAADTGSRSVLALDPSTITELFKKLAPSKSAEIRCVTPFCNVVSHLILRY